MEKEQSGGGMWKRERYWGIEKEEGRGLQGRNSVGGYGEKTNRGGTMTRATVLASREGTIWGPTVKEQSGGLQCLGPPIWDLANQPSVVIQVTNTLVAYTESPFRGLPVSRFTVYRTREPISRLHLLL